jgi:hypothetical protein
MRSPFEREKSLADRVLRVVGIHGVKRPSGCNTHLVELL